MCYALDNVHQCVRVCVSVMCMQSKNKTVSGCSSGSSADTNFTTVENVGQALQSSK